MLKKIFLLFVTAALILAAPDSESQGSSENGVSLDRLQKNIDRLLNTSILKGAKIGIQIVSLQTGQVVYHRNSTAALNPASNTKLITSAVALLKLSPEYNFKTTVYAHGAIKSGALQGDIYLKGGGDPVLSYENLLVLAQEVYNTGIRTITGNVVGDDSFFDEEREFSGWHDFSTAYSGKLSALSLNGNAVNLQIKPSRSGDAPQIILDPPTSYLEIKNKAVTLAAKNHVSASFADSAEIADEETVVVQGKVSTKSKYGVSARINVNQPSLFTTTTFKDALQQVGITITGKAALGVVPSKSERLATYSSEPLSLIIHESNKSSNNFVAEQILKVLGAEKIGTPGTTAKGIQVIQEFFGELNIAPDAYVLENGSGLSRNNRLSPEQIVTLLTYMYDDFAVRSEYIASLAIAGIDGTLERRMQDTTAERRLRAKTGAIRNVSCLSGYAASRDNEVFAFSIMMNNYRSGGYAVKNIQNKIGQLLTEFYRPDYQACRGNACASAPIAN